MTHNPAWQEKCTRELSACIALGPAGAVAWSARRNALHQEAQATIQPQEQARVIIADCDLRGQDLRSYAFPFTYFARVDFTGADLSHADFDRAILAGCTLVRANLRGVNFNRTKIDERTLGWDAMFDRTTRFGFTSGVDNLTGFDPHFRFSAEEGMRIADFQRKSGKTFLGQVYALMDHGRSVWRLSAACIFVALVFATVYWGCARMGWLAFDAGQWGYLDFVIMSGQRFLNANPMFGSGSLAAQSAFLAETALGYAALALFAGVMLRKLILFR